MKTSNGLKYDYKKYIVTSYFLFSILMKEGRLQFTRQPVVSVLINVFYYVSLLLIFLHLFSGTKIRVKSDILYYIKKFCPLLALYLLCESIAVIFNPQYGLMYGSSSVTHFASLFLRYIIMIPTIFLIYHMRRKKTLESLADALIINEIIIIISNLFEYGFGKTITDMFSLFTSIFSTSESVFEVDGPTYCSGLILLYYLFNKDDKIKGWKIAVLLFSLFVGRKRIAIFAFGVALLFKLITRKITMNRKKIVLLSLIICSFTLLYIALLYNSRFFDLMTQFGVGMSGRSFLYKYFIARSTFSLGHLPWGLGGVEMVFANVSYKSFANSYIATALHNDILRIYIELGFIGFVLWLIFMTYYLSNLFYKTRGGSGAKAYFCCLIFCLINYAVSNTFFYSPLFSLLVLIPLVTNEEWREGVNCCEMKYR